MPFNSPNIDGKRTHYSHQEITVDIKGTHVQIKKNGRITISQAAGKDPVTQEVLIDEIEVPASLIFDVAKLLHMTRVTELVDASNDSRNRVESKE